jgi:hypothetical protein
MVQAIVVRREGVAVEKSREANQDRYEVSPALPDQFVTEDGAKRQACAKDGHLNRRRERGNEMDGATENSEAD